MKYWIFCIHVALCFVLVACQWGEKKEKNSDLPFITGNITDIRSEKKIVVFGSTDSEDKEEFIFWITDDTTIQDQHGKQVTFEEIKRDDHVEVWLEIEEDGSYIIMESLPPQAISRKIVVH